MNLTKYLIMICMFLSSSEKVSTMLIQKSQKDDFEKVKNEISKRESANGLLKINVNKNGSVDCGLYHINSVHFKLEERTQLQKDLALVFILHGIQYTFHDRVAAAIINDSLNEDLARVIFFHKGRKAWTSMRRDK